MNLREMAIFIVGLGLGISLIGLGIEIASNSMWGLLANGGVLLMLTGSLILMFDRRRRGRDAPDAAPDQLR